MNIKIFDIFTKYGMKQTKNIGGLMYFFFLDLVFLKWARLLTTMNRS